MVAMYGAIAMWCGRAAARSIPPACSRLYDR
jgi:hypothetical protein